MAEYTVEFCNLAIEAGWHDLPLMEVYRRGLNRRLWDAVALRRRPENIHCLISIAMELDNYLQEQRSDSAFFRPALGPRSPPLTSPARTSSAEVTGSPRRPSTRG